MVATVSVHCINDCLRASILILFLNQKFSKAFEFWAAVSLAWCLPRTRFSFIWFWGVGMGLQGVSTVFACERRETLLLPLWGAKIDRLSSVAVQQGTGMVWHCSEQVPFCVLVKSSLHFRSILTHWKFHLVYVQGNSHFFSNSWAKNRLHWYAYMANCPGKTPQNKIQ